MNTRIFHSALVFAALTASAASAAMLATLKKEAPAYPNSSRRVFEKPAFHSGKGDLVEIVRWSMPLSQVRTRSGRLGWVESSMLDTVNIPAVLSIAPPQAKPAALSAADDSAVAKRWMAAQKSQPTAPSAAEKPLDFPKDSSHIPPRTPQDSAK